MNIVVPIILTLLLALIVTLNNLTNRFLFNRGSLPSKQIAADSALLQAFINLVLFLVFPRPYSSEIFWYIAIGSVAGTLGLYFITEATIYGKAGPSQALVECQTLWCLCLEVTILGKIPNWLQLVAFGCGIIGGLLIALERQSK